MKSLAWYVSRKGNWTVKLNQYRATVFFKSAYNEWNWIISHPDRIDMIYGDGYNKRESAIKAAEKFLKDLPND